MKMTIEIDYSQAKELLKLAAQDGDTDLSTIIRRALDMFIRQHRRGRGSVQRALQLRGRFSDLEADALEAPSDGCATAGVDRAFLGSQLARRHLD
jgi:hypothetical protein